MSTAIRRILMLVGVALVAGASDGLFQWVTETDDGIRVVAVWDGKEQNEPFAEEQIGGLLSRADFAAPPAAITVNQTGAPSGLYPGGPAAALAGTFTNPNAGPVSISSVTAAVHVFASHTVDATKPDCTEADFAIAGTSGANVIPAGIGVGSWLGLTVRLLDNGLNQDNCKSVSITIDYTANPLPVMERTVEAQGSLASRPSLLPLA